MTRRDSEVGVNDAEGDRGGSSSRSPAAAVSAATASSSSSSTSPDEKAWRDKQARKASNFSDEESKLSPERQRRVIRKNAETVDVRMKEREKFHRISEVEIETDIITASETARQPFRRKKMDVFFGQVIETTGVACGSAASSAIITASHQNNAIFSTTSGSSSPAGETRLTASILFDLPESCGSSAGVSTDKMPAITKAQMKEFEDAFNLFDKDRDGSITKEELGRVMRGLGQFARTEELRTMLEEIDTDGDGNVSLVEFVKIVSNIGSASAAAPTDLSQEEQEEQELRDAFRVFDKHNRGYITASDLRAVLQCLGEDLSEEEIEDMIKEVDEDGDGRIDFYEFARSLVEPGTDDEDEDEEDEETPQSPPF